MESGGGGRGVVERRLKSISWSCDSVFRTKYGDGSRQTQTFVHPAEGSAPLALFHRKCCLFSVKTSNKGDTRVGSGAEQQRQQNGINIARPSISFSWNQAPRLETLPVFTLRQPPAGCQTLGGPSKVRLLLATLAPSCSPRDGQDVVVTYRSSARAQNLGLDKGDEALCLASAAPHGGRCRTKASVLAHAWALHG